MKIRLVALFIAVAILFVAVISRAADSNGTSVPEADQVKILKAKLELSDAQNAFVSLQVRYQDLSQQIQKLQAEAEPATKKIAEAEKTLRDLTDAAARSLGLDPAKFVFDSTKMTFVPKVEPAPALPSPAKK